MPPRPAASAGPAVPLARARAVAARILGRLAREPSALRLAAAGGLRRMAPRVEGVLLLATAYDPAALLQAFLDLPTVAGSRAPGGDVAFGRAEGDVPVALRVLPADDDLFAAQGLWLSARQDHFAALSAAADARGLLLDPRGLWREQERLPAPDEAAIYDHLGLPFFPPELREGSDLEPPPEDLLEAGDVCGAALLATDRGSGRHALALVAGRARREGYGWLLLADEGLDPAAAVAQREEARACEAEAEEEGAPLAILQGARVAASGLDAPGAGAFVLVLEPADDVGATRAALSHPRVKVLGPARGEVPPPWTRDLEAWSSVLDACARHRVVPAVSGAADAAPLPPGWHAAARARGLRALPAADARDVEGLEQQLCAVGALRRGRWRRGEVLGAVDAAAARAWAAGGGTA